MKFRLEEVRGLSEVVDNGNKDVGALWDEYGRPKLPHVACPRCGDADEVGSSFDHVWCHICAWHGSLTEQRRSAPEMVITSGLPRASAPTCNVVELFPKRR